jgi:hypothetical protein
MRVHLTVFEIHFWARRKSLQQAMAKLEDWNSYDCPTPPDDAARIASNENPPDGDHRAGWPEEAKTRRSQQHAATG